MRDKKLLLIVSLTFFLLPVFLSGNSRDNLNLGRKMFDDGFYNEAINVFNNILNTASQSPEAEEALFYIGKAHQINQRYEEAARSYNRFLENYPNSVKTAEILHNLVQCYFKLGEFQRVTETVKLLLNDYPGSSFLEKSLILYIESYFQMENFNEVIISGNEVVNRYSSNPDVPEILLLTARAYYKNNMQDSGDSVIKRIIDNYPNHNSKWKAIELKAVNLIDNNRLESAISTLQESLSSQVPRIYEERYRRLLTEMYFRLEDYQKVSEELTRMIAVFDRSEHLDSYLHKKFQVNSKLDNYQETIEVYNNYADFIDKSVYKDKIFVHVANAFFTNKNYSRAESLINVVLDSPETEKAVKFSAKVLRAKIKEMTNRYLGSIEDYIEILSKYPELVENDAINFRIGNLYFNYFNDYNTAINFYQQALNYTTSVVFQSEVLYNKALCYEKMNNFEEAYLLLSRINLNTLEDKEKQKQIQNKIFYLENYLIIDYKRATINLTHSILNYLDNDNKEQLRKSLIGVMAENLKEYEQTLSYLEKINDPQLLYKKSLIILKLAERNFLDENQKEYLFYVEKLESAIDDLKVTQPEPYSELSLRLELLKNRNVIDETIENRILSFIETFPESLFNDELKFLLTRFYTDNNFYDKAYMTINKVQNLSKLHSQDFNRIVLTLAQHFYKLNQFDKSLKLFSWIEDSINIYNPDILYKYAVLLDNSGQTDKSIEILSFLIHNTRLKNDQTPPFSEFFEAIDYLSSIYRERRNFDLSLNTLMTIPHSLRSADQYRLLSEDFKNLDNKQASKEMLMHIQDKTLADLRKLANLHYLTKDYVMAEYTYYQLVEKETNNNFKLQAKQMLGHLYFLKDNFSKAIENYNKVIQKIPDNYNPENFPLLNIAMIAEESVISSYKLQNRPRAESLQDKFRQTIRANNEIMHNISLHEAIYNMAFNRRSAHRSFTNLIGEENISPEIFYQAYFWRGVNHLEQKETDLAFKDFLEAAKSPSIQTRNEAKLKLGTISFSKEQFQQALDYYSSVIENDQTGKIAFDAAKNYAIVAKTIEEWEKAIAVYHIILERWGNIALEAETLFDIGFCYYRNRQYRESIETFERAMRLLSDTKLKAEAQYWIGESYLGLNNFESAITSFLMVSYNYPNFIEWAAVSDLKVGEIYIRLNQFDKARQILENIKRKYGATSDWGRQADLMLNQL